MHFQDGLRGGISSLAQRVAGYLAFFGLALSAFIAGRDECPERVHAQVRRAQANLSTLAPIMGSGPGAQGVPADSGRTKAGDLFSPPAPAAPRAGSLACLYQPGTPAQAGRSAKLKPTP
ncbi:hypothetical protein [Variovorax sp. GB1P17]|uniref:hypothetical protein n=1 Tax=Variovorax sp. GB1P17 TaxID=3443740 RepID=UPI003F44BA37